MNFLLICLGGSLGALSRFYLSSLIEKQEYIEIPLGIMAVNILGCFFLGLFYTKYATAVCATCATAFDTTCNTTRILQKLRESIASEAT